MIPIRDLFEAHLTVANLQRSMSFFGDALGLELAQVFPERKVAFYWIGRRGDSMIGLWEAGMGPQRMKLHVAFSVDLDNLLQAADRLREANIILSCHLQETLRQLSSRFLLQFCVLAGVPHFEHVAMHVPTILCCPTKAATIFGQEAKQSRSRHYLSDRCEQSCTDFSIRLPYFSTMKHQPTLVFDSAAKPMTKIPYE